MEDNKIIKRQENNLLDELIRYREELLNSERRNQTIINAISDIMFQIRKDGTFLSYQSKEEDLYISPDKFLNKKVSEVLPFDLANLTIQKIKQTLKTNITQIYEYSLPISGELRYFECKMIKNSEDDVLTFIRDISDKKFTEEKLKHINTVLKAIRNVNQIITREKNKEVLLQRICDNLIETRGYYNSWIILKDEYDDLKIVAQAGKKENFSKIFEQLRKSELSTNLATSYNNCIFHEISSDKIAITSPLQYNNKIYGFLTVSIPSNYVNIEEEQTLFKEVSEDISFVLYSLELEENREKTEKLIHIQRDLAIILSQTNDLKNALNHILEYSLKIEEFDCGAIYIINEVGDLEIIVHKGLSPEFIKSTSYYKGDSPQFKLIMKGKPIYGIYSEIELPIDEVKKEEDLKFIAILPVLYKEKIVAVMNLSSHTSKDIPIYVRETIESISNQIGEIINRIKTEQILKENEQRYKTLVETSPEAIIVTDMVGNITYASPQTLKLYDFTNYNELIGKNSFIFIAPEDHKKAIKYTEDIMKKGFIKNIEYDMIKKDGTRFIAELNISLIKDISGNPQSFIATIRDITNRKIKEEKIFRQNNILNAINKVFQDSLKCTNKEELVFSCLNILINLTNSQFGWIGELNEKNFIDIIMVNFPKNTHEPKTSIFVKKDIKICKICLEILKKEQSFIINNSKICKKKTCIIDTNLDITSFLGVPLKHGGIIALFNKELGYTTLDLEAVEKLSIPIMELLTRKKMEEELLRSYKDLEIKVQERTSKLTKLNEQLKQEIIDRKKIEDQLRESEERYKSVIDNISMGISVISPDMRILSLNNQMKKWFPHIDVSKNPICYKSFNIPPKDNICSYCPTYKTLKDGEIHEDITETPVGNEIKNYKIISSPLRNKKGEIIAAIEMVEDVTEEREVEKLKSNLIAIVSHELKTPLTSIIGYSEMIEDYSYNLSDTQKKYTRAIINQSKKLLSMINNILDISKLESGTIELYKSNFGIKQLINEVIDSFSPIIEERDIRINYKLSKVNRIIADRERIYTILRNLIDNAIKFSEDHGEILITVEKIKDYVKISVIDKGLGIPKSKQERLFEKFYQVDTTLTRRVGGTGLGLNLCKRFIELHGGKIWVESQEGYGSKFIFTIPYSKGREINV